MSIISPAEKFREAVRSGSARLGVIGLGYVGLPLAVEMANAGYSVLGFEVSEDVVRAVNAGTSHIQDVPSDRLVPLVEAGRFEATLDMSRLGECDAISICVPTPLNKIKDPDLSYVLSAAQAIKATLRHGQLVILESTTYPGTTDEVLQPLLESSDLEVGRDVFLCFSPERVDPGNTEWHTKNTPKVLGGVTSKCTDAGIALYGTIFDVMVRVDSARAAELVKVYENTFRMINIALANEMAQACDRLDVNVWDVIEAAATKPFGFMRFTPGPGLGGHCIPLDPHYLSWKMKTLAFKTRMIELASEINSDMPAFVVHKIQDALNDVQVSIRGSQILIIGVSYKKNIDDLRESPALEIMRLLSHKGASVSYHDPHCPVITDGDGTPVQGFPMKSRTLDLHALSEVDCVVVVTDHDCVDYEFIRSNADLIIDTRGVMRGTAGKGIVIGLSGIEVASSPTSINQ